MFFQMAEHKSVEPVLMSSHSPNPDRRVVIFNLWRELKDDHGPKCWQRVVTAVHLQHRWRTSRIAVKRIVERILETNSYADVKMRRPQQLKATPRVRAAILNAATNHNKSRHQRSVRSLAKRTWFGTKVSVRTVHNVLKEAGLRFLKSGTRPFSSVHHDRMRKEFARIGKGLSLDRWMDLFFIDETHFETVHTPNRHNTGEWCAFGDVPEADMTVKHPGRVNAAMGICGHGLSKVALYRGRFNAKVFVSHVEDVYAPAMAEYDGVTTLMMDNDRSHHAALAVTAMETAGIVKCNPPPPPCWKATCTCPIPKWPWFPAYCPALSPLEIFFNDIQQRLDGLSDRAGLVTKLSDLERRVRKEHQATTPQYIKKLFASMPARCQSMFDNNGQRCLY